ncbi:MAG: murein biosynthesis integral membrane protein MurJ [bacterium]
MAEPTTNQKIAGATGILIAASILGHILSLGKEILIANYFGITKVMDAFYAAVTVPNMINNVLLTTFGAVFIPVFIKCELKNRDEANRIASTVMNYLFIFFIFISLTLFGFAPWIIKYGFHGMSPESINLAAKLLRIISFTLILSGMIGIMTGILNAFKHFTWPAFSQMFVTVFTILFILLFVKEWGIFVLAYGLLAGLFVQFFFLLPVAGWKGYRYYFDFNFKHPAVKEMLPLALLLFTVTIGGQLNIVVDRIMASYLAQGSIAALGYAAKLVQVPLIIFSGSVAVAVLPFFSSQVAENKIEEMKDTIAASIRMSGFIFIPLTVMTVILAGPVIQILFQRGAFTPQATSLTSIILICYSFQFFFYAVTAVLTRVFFALQDMVTLLKIMAVGAAMNVILNFVFMKIIKPPVAGLALSTSAVLLVIVFLCILKINRKNILLDWKYVFKGLGRMCIASAIMGVAIITIFSISAEMNLIARIILSASAGVLVFALMSYVIGIAELSKIFSQIKGMARVL